MTDDLTGAAKAATRDVLLALADDEHLMGQHHTEWIGVAPFLEEDLAFSSIGQDELGHALALYELVLELDGVEPTDGAIDELAFGRRPDEYRSCAFTEYVTDDWAEALVRHWVYDALETLRWGQLERSAFAPLRDVSARALREEAYHLRHANALLDRLLDDETSRDRLLAAFDTVWALVPSVLAPSPGEPEAVAAGVVVGGGVAELARPLCEQVGARLGRTVTVPTAAESRVGRDRTVRTASFEPLLHRMRTVLDAHPGAVW